MFKINKYKLIKNNKLDNLSNFIYIFYNKI